MFKLHQFKEHDDKVKIDLKSSLGEKFNVSFGRDKYGSDRNCLVIENTISTSLISTSYFIGVDWIDSNNAVYVKPKINDDQSQIDYLGMLRNCLKHPDIFTETKDLFKIKFDTPFIQVDKSDDLITPLLIIQYLVVLDTIVTKGLRKSYYKVENRLKSGIRGKIDMIKTTRSNLKSETVGIDCIYEEFGINNLDNRFLKKVLTFIQGYIRNNSINYGNIQHLVTKCKSSFAAVSDEIDFHAMKRITSHSIYKEYSEAIRIGKLILKRFGYNIQAIGSENQTKVPPFWIDMSKLFELYILGLLKERFGNDVDYHFTSRRNELDYLLDNSEYKMVIDAKYKTRYQNITGNDYKIEDVRQLSGYARLKAVYEKLNMPSDRLIDCLVIYPDQNASSELPNALKEQSIRGFQGFYKIPIRMPTIASN